nr:putative inactive carboxylesterase 4 [Cherax quadricarinatus]
MCLPGFHVAEPDDVTYQDQKGADIIEEEMNVESVLNFLPEHMNWMQHLAVCVWIAVVVTAGCQSLRAGRYPGHGPAVVSTAQGMVAGITEKSLNGRSFWSYYGIPYAKPPVGQLRLRDPLPAEPWDGLRNATVVPQPCLQVEFHTAFAEMRLTPQQVVGTEDCLYLNVFTPTVASPQPLPVMVYIPGGAFFAGGTHEYQPHVLLNHDIVLVVLQYRVGILGFLSTEDSVIPGNLGLKDQTMALHWVQNNIYNFGGDPNCVTIIGQSAGGAAVHFQILTPKSRGLFSRAIIQSGVALAPFALGNRHREIAERVGGSLGCDTRYGSTHLLACLQTLDAHELTATIQDFFEWSFLPLPLGPRVDGDFLPAHPALLLRDRQYNPVDILSGTTAHEGLIIAYQSKDRRGEDEIKAAVTFS